MSEFWAMIWCTFFFTALPWTLRGLFIFVYPKTALSGSQYDGCAVIPCYLLMSDTLHAHIHAHFFILLIQKKALLVTSL